MISISANFLCVIDQIVVVVYPAELIDERAFRVRPWSRIVRESKLRWCPATNGRHEMNADLRTPVRTRWRDTVMPRLREGSVCSIWPTAQCGAFGQSFITRSFRGLPFHGRPETPLSSNVQELASAVRKLGWLSGPD
jgi:hypothetical protein